MIFLVTAYFVVAMSAPAAVRRLGRTGFLPLALLPAATVVWAAVEAPGILDGTPVTESFTWLPAQGVDLAFRCDALGLLMLLLASGVGVLVLVYCARYFDDDEPGLGAFAGTLVAFAGAMVGLVTTDDLLLLYVFWELTTVFSYLLIGHRSERKGSRRAAMQALTMTTFGGLAMLVGLVLLGRAAGTLRLSAILAAPPTGPVVTVSVVLILVGALAKSAITPFGSWLPAAMAAPTPVSAYLHAAAMVKAGVYLIARIGPAFSGIGPWRPLVLTAGAVTLLLAGWRALRENDLKRVLAYGTVSQLGLLTVVLGAGTREAALAGTAMLLAHALFKSALFLVVGVIDHSAGTRDLRRLSNLRRGMPTTCAVAVLAALSMAGIPPTAGFVAKEGVYEAFLHGGTADTLALAALVVGSALTTGYSLRFVWGGFWPKPGVPTTRPEPIGLLLLAPALVLALAGVGLGLAAGPLNDWIAPYAGLFPQGEPYHLALWHGAGPALLLSIAALAGGTAFFLAREPVVRLQAVTARVEPSRVYDALVRGTDRFALQLTGATQRGSMPLYLGAVLVTLVGTVGVALSVGGSWSLPDHRRWWDSPAQIVTAVIVAVAAVAAARSSRRLRAVLLLGVTGYGSATLFVLQGAPDLALTQGLVETLSLVLFLLVLRRLPGRFRGPVTRPARRTAHVVIGVLVAVLIVVVTTAALAVRVWPSVSVAFPEAAAEGGGKNIVSILLVDVRGWDTMGELSVLAVAAVGVTSLVFLRRSRTIVPRGAGEPGHVWRIPGETHPAAALPGDTTGEGRFSTRWLAAGRTLAPERRTVLFEVITRTAFPTILVLSLYLLFSGHSSPGGGFAGGITAGMALLVRYLAGGRYELAAAVPLASGTLLGTGLVVATGAALIPLLVTGDALRSTVVIAHPPFLGEFHLATSLFFDIGVYLLVFGLVQDILRGLGIELDRQIEESSEADAERTVVT